MYTLIRRYPAPYRKTVWDLQYALRLRDELLRQELTKPYRRRARVLLLDRYGKQL